MTVEKGIIDFNPRQFRSRYVFQELKALRSGFLGRLSGDLAMIGTFDLNQRSCADFVMNCETDQGFFAQNKIRMSYG